MKELFGKTLSRDEMKNIVGGDDVQDPSGSGNKCAYACSSNSNCDSTCPSCDKGAWGDQKFCF
jgi:hypothetical protein